MAVQLCTISKYQLAQHPGCLGWAVHLPPPDILLAHHFHGKYSVNTLYLYHLISAKHLSLLAFRGILSMLSYGGFWMRGVDQRLFGLSAAAPPEKKTKSNPHRDSGSVSKFHPENKVTGRVKQLSTLNSAYNEKNMRFCFIIGGFSLRAMSFL